MGRSETDNSVPAAGTGARKSRLNDYGTSKFLRAGGDVEGVKPLEEEPALIGHGYQIERTRTRINHRSTGDSDYGCDNAPVVRVKASFGSNVICRINEADLP